MHYVVAFLILLVIFPCIVLLAIRMLARRLTKEQRLSSDGPSHVLFVLEYFHPHIGGVETLFGNLTAALVQRGYRVSVITLWLPGTNLREMVNGVEVLRVRTPHFARRYFFMLLAIPLVARMARTADIVHTTTYSASVPAWIGARLWNRPAILTVHEVFSDQWQRLRGVLPVATSHAFRLFEWGIFRLPFAHFVCDSRFTENRLQTLMRVPTRRTSVVYPAVDYDFWGCEQHQARELRREIQVDPGTFIYLYFGRPGISKGVEYLIGAARVVQREQPNSHLVLLLAHDPVDHYQRILRLIAQYNLHDHVTVLNPVPRADLPTYLLAADCVVVPSISEGFGYAAAEAVTLGCTVVATSGHSVEEIVGECVELVPSGDEVALAHAILKMATGKPPRREYRRYDIASHIERITSIYERVGTHSEAADAIGESGAAGNRETQLFS